MYDSLKGELVIRSWELKGQNNFFPGTVLLLTFWPAVEDDNKKVSDGPLEKLWGGGWGGGELSVRMILFFAHCMICFCWCMNFLFFASFFFFVPKCGGMNILFDKKGYV